MTNIEKLVAELRAKPGFIGAPSHNHTNEDGEVFIYQYFVISYNHRERLQEIFDALKDADSIIWRYNPDNMVDMETGVNKIRLRFAAVKKGKQVFVLKDKEYDPIKAANANSLN